MNLSFAVTIAISLLTLIRGIPDKSQWRWFYRISILCITIGSAIAAVQWRYICPKRLTDDGVRATKTSSHCNCITCSGYLVSKIEITVWYYCILYLSLDERVHNDKVLRRRVRCLPVLLQATSLLEVCTCSVLRNLVFMLLIIKKF